MVLQLERRSHLPKVDSAATSKEKQENEFYKEFVERCALALDRAVRFSYDRFDKEHNLSFDGIPREIIGARAVHSGEFRAMLYKRLVSRLVQLGLVSTQIINEALEKQDAPAALGIIMRLVFPTLLSVDLYLREKIDPRDPVESYDSARIVTEMKKIIASSVDESSHGVVLRELAALPAPEEKMEDDISPQEVAEGVARAVARDTALRLLRCPEGSLAHMDFLAETPEPKPIPSLLNMKLVPVINIPSIKKVETKKLSRRNRKKKQRQERLEEQIPEREKQQQLNVVPPSYFLQKMAHALGTQLCRTLCPAMEGQAAQVHHFGGIPYFIFGAKVVLDRAEKDLVCDRAQVAFVESLKFLFPLPVYLEILCSLQQENRCRMDAIITEIQPLIYEIIRILQHPSSLPAMTVRDDTLFPSSAECAAHKMIMERMEMAANRFWNGQFMASIGHGS